MTTQAIRIGLVLASITIIGANARALRNIDYSDKSLSNLTREIIAALLCAFKLFCIWSVWP